MVRVVLAPTPMQMDRAHKVIRAHLRPTPLRETDAAGGAVLKLENEQPTGSFKVRGALAAMVSLRDAAGDQGVVTASAGNHALGVAFAAGRLGVPATVVVPVTASAAKVAALRRFPVRLVQYGDDYAAAERHSLELASAGAAYVSPYNDPNVIAGASTIGPELRAELSGPLTIVVPVGGGGLVSGLSLWAAAEPDVRVVGVEAEASRALSTAVAKGRVVEVDIAPTLADGLAGNLEPGSVTPAIVAEHTHALTTVSEREIRHAMRFLAQAHGIIAEGSGAVAVAAVLSGRLELAGRAVAMVTGRNVALGQLAQVYAEPDGDGD